MSSLLARIARTLTHHWKRGLAGAIAVVVLLGVAAGAGGEAADDFNIPGTESQQALDLFKKHSPAFAGADSTLVFTVDQGKITDPAPRAAVTGALDKVRELKGVQVVEDPFAKGGTLSQDGKLASVAVRYSTEPQDLKKPDGEALVKAAETGEKDGVSVVRARHPHRPRLRAGGAGRRAGRRGDRDRAADAAVPLAGGDGRHPRRRADRRGRRPDPAGRAGRPARPAGLRDRDRGDARPRCGHRLLALDHRPGTGTDGGR